MTTCYACGHVTPKRSTRGALTTQEAPAMAWWRGEHLRLTPQEAAILHALCSAEIATVTALQKVGVGPNADPGNIYGVICTFKKKLPAGVQVRNVWRRGYRLTVEGE